MLPNVKKTKWIIVFSEFAPKNVGRLFGKKKKKPKFGKVYIVEKLNLHKNFFKKTKPRKTNSLFLRLTFNFVVVGMSPN